MPQHRYINLDQRHLQHSASPHHGHDNTISNISKAIEAFTPQVSAQFATAKTYVKLCLPTQAATAVYFFFSEQG